MMNRMYVIDGAMEFTRKEFETHLVEVIYENELYDLKGLHGDDPMCVERHVKHHPLALAKEIYGENRVVTYTR